MYRPLLAAVLLLAPVALSAQPEGEPTAVAPSEAPEQAEAAPPAAEATGETLSRVTLKDGQVLVGKVVRHDTDGVVLEVSGGARLTLSAEAVERVDEEHDARVTSGGTVRFADPGRTRYLFGNSALMLRGGEGFFSQRELFLTLVSLGLTDHLTVSVGSVLPLFVVDRRYVHVAGGVKVGGSVSERLHLAGGVEAVVLPIAPSTFGLVFGAVTYGTPDAQLTLSAGIPFEFYSGGNRVAELVAWSLGGSLRLTDRLAGVTEHWALLGPSYIPTLVNSVGLRVLGERWTVDLGGAYATGLPFPLPWVNFSWHWD
ncbi:hypothetical protein [Archangium sp.]|jgi:hypothetical protein|uniref:hypothetical protein n=1 Tax=Archangium sp. TaxID=1872627 RepID=UPI002EDBB6C1